MSRKANNFAILNDVIGACKQFMGKRGRIYQIINVGRNKRYVIIAKMIYPLGASRKLEFRLIDNLFLI